MPNITKQPTAEVAPATKAAALKAASATAAQKTYSALAAETGDYQSDRQYGASAPPVHLLDKSEILAHRLALDATRQISALTCDRRRQLKKLQQKRVAIRRDRSLDRRAASSKPKRRSAASVMRRAPSRAEARCWRHRAPGRTYRC
jgi:hypothetical protein